MVDLVRRLEAVQTRLDGLEVSEPVEVDTVALLHRQADYLDGVLIRLDPDLTPPDSLKTVGAALDVAEAALVEYVAIPSLERLLAVRDALYDAIRVGAFVPNAGRDPEIMKRAAIRYRRAAREATEAVEARIEALAEVTKGLEVRASQLDGELTEKVSAAAATIEAQLAPTDTRVSDLATAAATQVKRIDDAVTSYQGLYTAAEAKRADAASEALDQFKADAKTLIDTHASASDDALKEQEHAAKQMLEELTKHEAAARRLVSKTGSSAVSGGYLGYANAERLVKFAWWIVGVVVISVVALYGNEQLQNRPVTIDIPWLGGRLLVALPLLGLALFAFAQAGRSGRNEREARAMELDLQALDPYIELLEEPGRSQLKERLADRAFFRQPPQATLRSETDVMKELIGLLRDAIKKS